MKKVISHNTRNLVLGGYNNNYTHLDSTSRCYPDMFFLPSYVSLTQLKRKIIYEK